MGKTRPPYPAEFRQQIVELAQAGRSVAELFELVMANQADFPVRTLCRVLGVSASGYYAWCVRKPSRRKLENAVLCEHIRSAHTESDETYGRPRIAAELGEQGVFASEKRSGRLMRLMGIQGAIRRWARFRRQGLRRETQKSKTNRGWRKSGYPTRRPLLP